MYIFWNCTKTVTNTNFNVGEFTFECLQGEWQVLKNNQHIDVFTFRYMSEQEMKQVLNDIFYNTEKVTFQ